ncbi:MAG TPA: cytochrome C oxidase Cbb3 [Verrucomicrobiales bacterium]|nr:cytochrome C oxidase Cbb3 [Verrucomicrobiales bacterium]
MLCYLLPIVIIATMLGSTMKKLYMIAFARLLIGTLLAQSVPPRDALALDAAQWPENYRLHLDGAAKVRLADGLRLDLTNAGPHDIAVEHPAAGTPVLRVWSAGKLVRGPEDAVALANHGAKDFPDAKIDFGADFTSMVVFTSQGDGTLFSHCAPQGKWSPDAKALFLRDGHLVYDIGWLGAMSGGPKVNNGKTHTVVLSVREGRTRLWLNGKKIAEQAGHQRADIKAHVLKVGRAAPDFGGALSKGKIARVRIWKRALPDDELTLLFKNAGEGANTPDFAYTPVPASKPVIESGTGWVQALERSDHAEIVRGWNDQTLAEGREIYETLCAVCHGTKDKAGSLPTAILFAEGEFKNGADPYSMYLTLSKGYGQMVAQNQYTTAQKYAVIQYIREAYLRPHNAKQLTKIDETYLSSLPKGMARAEAEKEDRSRPPYEQMDFGPALFWTLQVDDKNIAQKAIAIRLDQGPGGVSKGRAWMVYDHDTMSLATATTGSFVDWKGIAFDGSHGTHTSLTGEKHFINTVGPGWTITDFEDKRTPAKDGKRYGPHPGIKYKGLYVHPDQCVIEAEIFGAKVLESPSYIGGTDNVIFVRTINVGESPQALRLRVAPDSVNVLGKTGNLQKENGFWVATLPANTVARFFISQADLKSLENASSQFNQSSDLKPFLQGAPPRWAQDVITTSIAGKNDGAFIADEFPLPIANPWQSWLRPGGFDFTPDGKAAIVAMWNGDVWRVEGVMEKAPATLRWRRIASGLFQPLGVKFRGDELFITCRDQIAKLVDLNGDGETDFIECFNNDAQVTEHFHEFAMGLQTDKAGNFYYAKSARHALDSVVPQHGTLLRVSADGARTDIVAAGFRAANGVCLEPDGSFFVTDQEGHWTPKNRINHVKAGGFYGNMYGYTDVTDSSDQAMQQPMVWITNAKDRSPAELLRVPKDQWGNLGGALLNLSYGTGQVFVVPYEEVNGQWQGAVCELPMPAFATGVMRGRFGSDGALYACGMFAWAGNAAEPGGFHRLRRSEKPARLPLIIRAHRGGMRVTFSEAMPEDAACNMKVWSLLRSKNYGSQHLNERNLAITKTQWSDDYRSVNLTIPDLAPTHCYELKIGDCIIHGTIHELGTP